MSEQIKFEDELQKFLHASPFVPFELIFSSGDRYAVLDPGMAFVGDHVVVIFSRGLATLFSVRIKLLASKRPFGHRQSRAGDGPELSAEVDD